MCGPIIYLQACVSVCVCVCVGGMCMNWCVCVYTKEDTGISNEYCVYVYLYHISDVVVMGYVNGGDHRVAGWTKRQCIELHTVIRTGDKGLIGKGQKGGEWKGGGEWKI